MIDVLGQIRRVSSRDLRRVSVPSVYSDSDSKSLQGSSQNLI